MAVSGLLAAGLVSAGVPAQAVAPRAERAVATTVSISGTRVITMPTTLHPGVQKFVVTSKKESLFQVVQAKDGYTAQQAAKDINAGLNKGNDLKALKRFQKNVTLVGGIDSTPGHAATVWLDIPTGANVWAIDAGGNYAQASKFVPLTVTGDDTGAGWPSSPKVKAVKLTTWASKPASIPTHGKLTFKNVSGNNHFLEMFKLAKGKTLKDFAAWIKAVKMGQNSPPPIDFRARSASTGVISPYQAMTFKYHLDPGTYIMACFWPDASMGGMPHAFMGMYRSITVK